MDILEFQSQSVSSLKKKVKIIHDLYNNVIAFKANIKEVLMSIKFLNK